ncbi:hypothetical protein COCON_G00103330 [Conger conger]|uniref:Uncharacterized protein n=1 Tax=Conger conger TaxID=82655 RepID=A0A9Q1DI98_CONCO|nr:hypothetical protein COCON_G00103330 [Conger conger]
MVGVGMEKIACLLLCLSLLSDRGDCVLSEQTLQPIMQDMFKRFNQSQLIQQIRKINQKKTEKWLQANSTVLLFISQQMTVIKESWETTSLQTSKTSGTL